MNAHLVLEEYAPAPSVDSRSASRPALVTLSARTGQQLIEQARRLRDHLRDQPLGSVQLSDLAFTLQVGRDVMEERLATLVVS